MQLTTGQTKIKTYSEVKEQQGCGLSSEWASRLFISQAYNNASSSSFTSEHPFFCLGDADRRALGETQCSSVSVRLLTL